MNTKTKNQGMSTGRKTAYTFTGNGYTIASDGADTTTVNTTTNTTTIFATCSCPTGLK